MKLKHSFTIFGLVAMLGLGVGVGLASSKAPARETVAEGEWYWSGKGGYATKDDADAETGEWGWRNIEMIHQFDNTYKITLYCKDYVEFSFRPNDVWVDATTDDTHYGSGVTNIGKNGNNYRVNLTAGYYDIYFSYKADTYQELFIAANSNTNKTVKFLKEGGSWSPSKIHYFVPGTDFVHTVWPGVALSTDYSGISGMYYIDDVQPYFCGYVLTSDEGTVQSVDVFGSTSGDELFFFDGTKTEGNYNVSAKSSTHNAGFYIFGDSTFTGSAVTAWTILGAVASDATPVAGNAASWASVAIASGANFKIGYYENDGSITFQNAGWGSCKAEDHEWFTWEDEKASHNIVCSVAGTYKVFLASTTYCTYINKDATIACYSVCGGEAAFVANRTGNSDIALSSTIEGSNPFVHIAGYEFVGYYSDAECTQELNLATKYPAANMNLYAKYETVVVNFINTSGTAIGDALEYNAENEQWEGIHYFAANEKFAIKKVLGTTPTTYYELDSGMSTHTDIATNDGEYVKVTSARTCAVYLKNNGTIWVTGADASLEAYMYAGFFLTNVGCDPNGVNLPSGWGTVAARYTNLSGDAKDIIYGFDIETPDDNIANMLKRYNLACNNHPTLEKFVKDSGGTARVVPASAINTYVVPISSETSFTLIAVIVASIGVVLVIGGYFYLRKRKEDR